jgi:hypothetical protein
MYLQVSSYSLALELPLLGTWNGPGAPEVNILVPPPSAPPQVRCSATQRGELKDLVEISRLNVIDVGDATMIASSVSPPPPPSPPAPPQVRCSATQRGELRDLVEIFRLNVIDVGHATMTLEVQGREDKMGAIVDLLEPYGEPGGQGLGFCRQQGRVYSKLMPDGPEIVCVTYWLMCYSSAGH